MYLWKCWRDTRYLFVTFLVVLMFFPSVFTISARVGRMRTEAATPATGTLVPGESPEERIRSRAQSAWNSLVGFGLFFVVLAAVSLGSNSPGDDFRQGTLEYLLTRPRTRGYFVWSSWAVGIAEIIVLLLGCVAVRYAVILHATGAFWTWRLAGAVPLLWCVASVSYGLSYFITMAARSGRIGVSCSLLVIASYVFVSAFVRSRWRVDLPSPASGIDEWFSHPTAWFLVQKIWFWTIAAVVLPFVSQVMFERAEP